MEEVKKTKKQKPKKAQPKVKKVKESRKIEVIDESEEAKGLETLEEPKESLSKNADESEEVDSEEKKSKRGWIILLLLLVLLAGGGFAAKTFLTRTTVETETVKLSDDARGVSNYFKEYLVNRIKAERLFSYTFKELKNEEVLNELTELKDGFSKVSRGVSGNYNSGEYKELAEIMESDALMYLSAVRELRSAMTTNYANENERQSIFLKKVEETTAGLRSALYIAVSAFSGDVSGFSSKGALIFEGPIIVEVGGGVMNVLLGSFDEKIVATSTDQLDEGIKLIDAVKLYGYASTRLVNIGTSLSGEMEPGWVEYVKVDVSRTEATFTRTRISTVMKSVWSLDEELKGQGIKGLVETDEKTLADELNEVVKGLTGKK